MYKYTYHLCIKSRANMLSVQLLAYVQSVSLKINMKLLNQLFRGGGLGSRGTFHLISFCTFELCSADLCSKVYKIKFDKHEKQCYSIVYGFIFVGETNTTFKIVVTFGKRGKRKIWEESHWASVVSILFYCLSQWWLRHRYLVCLLVCLKRFVKKRQHS